MNDELKSLVADAAKLLGLELIWDGVCPPYFQTEIGLIMFNPLDPERGDLMKVAMAAELTVDFEFYTVTLPVKDTDCFPEEFDWIKGDHQSLAIAILRAASAVLHSRGGV